MTAGTTAGSIRRGGRIGGSMDRRVFVDGYLCEFADVTVGPRWILARGTGPLAAAVAIRHTAPRAAIVLGALPVVLRRFPMLAFDGLFPDRPTIRATFSDEARWLGDPRAWPEAFSILGTPTVRTVVAHPRYRAALYILAGCRVVPPLSSTRIVDRVIAALARRHTGKSAHACGEDMCGENSP